MTLLIVYAYSLTYCQICTVTVVDKTLVTTPVYTFPFNSDGVGRTGTFICIHSQLEKLKSESVVDIFQAVKSARIQRAGLVADVVSLYTCLYNNTSLITNDQGPREWLNYQKVFTL